MKESLPLTRRFPQLTHFADTIFRNDGKGAVLITASFALLIGLVMI